MAGSSPLTRGKHGNRPDAGRAIRLIPAHAGKTPHQGQRRRPWPAHPRSRGENFLSAGARALRAGSSPLTRGKPLAAGIVPHVVRLIPAHAGKTASLIACMPSRTAHPRSRGENSPSRGSVIAATGSSPLTRGKLISVVRVSPSPRLIPAHAGKTDVSGLGGHFRSAHPRSRGENEAELSPSSDDSGSSPLTRGKHTPLTQARSQGRLIPAHAGKTLR